MKKIFLPLICILSILTFSSCSSNKRTGTPEVSANDMIGSLEEVPYENIMDLTNFKLAFDNYINHENPLQLKNGTSGVRFIMSR